MKNHTISTPIRTRIHTRKGATLISMIVVMLIIGILGVAVITLTNTTEHSHLSANAGSRAYYLAESGLRYAQQVHCDTFAIDGEGWRHGREQILTLLGGEQVHVYRDVGSIFWATAAVDVGTAQEARAEVPMALSLCGIDPNENPEDEFAIFGEIGISLGNNTIVQGDVAITDGAVDIQGDVNGSVLAVDVEMTSSDATVDGDIFSSGSVDIKTGTVTGDIHSANGIVIGSAQSTVIDGWLFSNGDIEVGGSALVGGRIYSCGGNVTIDGSAIIGTAIDPIEIRTTGNIDLSGSAVIYGDIHAGGNILVGGNNTVHGNAYAGGTISNPDSVTGTALPNSPTYVKEPVCPDLTNLEDLDLPDATVFTAGGADIILPSDGTEELPSELPVVPGTYGVLSSANNAAHTLLKLNAGSTGHGNYYFDSIDLGSNLTLKLDLSGTYDIRIFVVGDIEFRRDLNVLVSADGMNYSAIAALTDEMKLALGARVYWESHGDYSLGQTSNWFGTVYTPDGNLESVGGTAMNPSYLIGSFFSGGGHSLQNSQVFHVPPNYFAEVEE